MTLLCLLAKTCLFDQKLMTSANVGARLTVGTRYIVCDDFETLQTFDVIM